MGLAQAYHPLFVCCAVLCCVWWLYRFIKLAKLKLKYWSLKPDENEIKTHKIVVMLFCFVFLYLLCQNLQVFLFIFVSFKVPILRL